MSTKRVFPKFANEEEEATWYFEHADELAEDFDAAAANGTLGYGRLARRFGLQPNVVYLQPADANLAREQAERRGIDYDKYVQGLIHEALLKDCLASASEGTSTRAAA
jgi:hypothetical protein